MIRWLSVCVGVAAVLAMTPWHAPAGREPAQVNWGVTAAAEASPARTEPPDPAPEAPAVPRIRGYYRGQTIYVDLGKVAARLSAVLTHDGPRLRVRKGSRRVTLPAATRSGDGWLPSPEGVMAPLRAVCEGLGVTLVACQVRPVEGDLGFRWPAYSLLEPNGLVAACVPLAGRIEVHRVARMSRLGELTLVVRGPERPQQDDACEDGERGTLWAIRGGDVLAAPTGFYWIYIWSRGGGWELRDVTGDGRAELVVHDESGYGGNGGHYTVHVLAVERHRLRPLLGGPEGIEVEGRAGGLVLSRPRHGAAVCTVTNLDSHMTPTIAHETTYRWSGVAFKPTAKRQFGVPDDDTKERIIFGPD